MSRDPFLCFASGRPLGSPQRDEGEKPRSFDRGGSRRYGAEQSGGSFDHTLTGQRNFAGDVGYTK